MRASVEPCFSIQTESELWTKKPVCPMSGSDLPHRAAGVEQRAALVRDGDAGRLARAQMRLDLIGEVMDIDDRLGHASFGEAVKHAVEERSPPEAYQRLGQRVGQRAHALAETGREHERAGWTFAGHPHLPFDVEALLRRLGIFAPHPCPQWWNRLSLPLALSDSRAYGNKG